MNGPTAEDRFCPVCGETASLKTCGVDGVPTVPRGLVGRDAPMDLSTPVGGRWTLESKLGAGGMAEVFRGRETGSGAIVAVKLLRASLSRDPRALQRFYREAAILEALEGPAFPRLFAFGFDDARGVAYLVMTLVDGQRLTALCPLPWRDAARVCAAVARALADAHGVGIIHRDLKPDNVIVARRGGDWDVTVMDFGVARRLDEDDPTLTETGAPVGTPSCMAPEQIEGREVDARTDLYALGCLLHRTLTGQRLFDADSAELMLRHHLVAAPPALAGDTADAEAPLGALSALRDQLLAKRMEDRPASAAWVAEALDAIARGEHPVWLESPEEALQDLTHPGTHSKLGDIRREPMPDPSGPTADHASRRRRLWPIGALTSGSALLLATVLTLSPDSDDAARPRLRAAAVSALPSAAAPVHPPTTPSAPSTVTPTPAPASAPTPSVRRVKVTSVPPAAVFHGAVRLGTTPIDVDLEAGESRELLLRRDGYDRERLSLDDASPSEIVVRLRRTAPMTASPPRPTSAATPWSPQPF